MKSSYFRILQVFLCLFFIISLNNNSISQESNSDDGIIVVKIENLDPYLFGDIFKEFRNHGQITLKEACVPTELIAFEITSAGNVTEASAYDTIKEIVLGVSSEEAISLTTHDLNSFKVQCLQSRAGQ